MRKVHVNYNDGNQISLPQQWSMRPREKFEIKEGAGSKDYPLAFGMTTIIRLLKKNCFVALWKLVFGPFSHRGKKRTGSFIER